MSLKKLNVYALVFTRASMGLIDFLLRSSKDQDPSTSSTHARPYRKTAYCKQKPLLNSSLNLFQRSSTMSVKIPIMKENIMSIKNRTFNKALFLKKSSANVPDVKETKQPLNDIPKGTVCMTTVPEVQQGTTSECVIPKAVEVVEPEKAYPPIASPDQVDTQILEALPVDTESNSVMFNEECCITQESWNEEGLVLTDWFNFQFSQGTLPTTKIKINVSPTHVFEAHHPSAWYKRLSETIAQGPSGTQAKHGFLQQELRLLKTYVERFDNIGKR